MTRKAPPKQAEKVACGSVTPSSVPATLAVYPLTKWYMVWPRDNLLTGGNTLRAPGGRVEMKGGKQAKRQLGNEYLQGGNC